MFPHFQLLLNAALALLMTAPPVAKPCCCRAGCCNSQKSADSDGHGSTSNCSHHSGHNCSHHRRDTKSCSYHSHNHSAPYSCNTSPPCGCRCVRQMAPSFTASRNAVKSLAGTFAPAFVQRFLRESKQGLVENSYAEEPRPFQGRRLQVAFCIWRC